MIWLALLCFLLGAGGHILAIGASETKHEAIGRAEKDQCDADRRAFSRWAIALVLVGAWLQVWIGLTGWR